MKIFEINVIGQFMYDVKLDAFLADLCRVDCSTYPYLMTALNTLIRTWYRFDCTQADADQGQDSEWTDDSTDEQVLAHYDMFWSIRAGSAWISRMF